MFYLIPLVCGVPQGSVAGALFFTLFSAPLQDIMSSHGINSVVYADDTQLYITFHPKDRITAVQKIEALPTSAHGVRMTDWY